MALDLRKADTRRKIALGGLVIKAGLGGWDPAALLGLLIEASADCGDRAKLERLRAIGFAAMARGDRP